MIYMHWMYLNLEQVKHLNQCWQLMFHDFICWLFCCFWFLSRALDGSFSILPFLKRCKHCCHFFCFVDIGQLQNVVLCCPWSVLEVRHLAQHVTIQWFVQDRLLLYGDVSCCNFNPASATECNKAVKSALLGFPLGTCCTRTGCVFANIGRCVLWVTPIATYSVMRTSQKVS